MAPTWTLAFAERSGALLRLAEAFRVDRGHRLHLAHHLPRRLILAHALIRRLPHAVAMRPAVEIDLHHHLRVHPDRRARTALLLRQGVEGGLVALERLEFAVQVARALMGETGAGAAGIAQFAVIVDAEHQRADRMRVRARGRKARDHEFLPVRTFGLDPVVAAAGMIGRVGALRDDAFQAHPAGMFEQHRAAFCRSNSLRRKGSCAGARRAASPAPPCAHASGKGRRSLPSRCSRSKT